MSENPYRNVFITGASSGIGRAMALWWARRGATVFAAARREAELTTLAAAGSIEPMLMDVTRERELVTRMRELDDRCGGLDLVIANAGVGDPTPARAVEWDELERLLRVNVMGAAATITALLPRMVARDRGHVVGISSLAAYGGLGAYSGYCGSKAFLSTFLESVRVDLHGTSVRTTVIEPGFVRTALTARLEGKAPMPFVVDADVAADRFGRAILRGARRFAFPKVHAIPARLIQWLPRALYEPLAQRASRPQLALFESDREKAPTAEG